MIICNGGCCRRFAPRQSGPRGAGKQEEGSMDFQVQAKRHLDEDIEKILELAAPEVTGTERDRLKQLISTYRDVRCVRFDRCRTWPN